MSLEARCKCGWNGQVSEVYLNGNIPCPDCGENIEVSRPSSPYAYPPFSSWESQRPKSAPTHGTTVYRRPPVIHTSRAESWNALFLGVAAVVLSFGRFSWIAALVLAMCAIAAGWRARSTAVSEGRRKPFKATLGMLAGTAALLIGTTGALSGHSACGYARAVSKEARAQADAVVPCAKREDCRVREIRRGEPAEQARAE